MLAGLEILTIGIIVVLAVLCMLWASCSIVGYGFRTIEVRQQAAEARKRDAAAAAASVATAPASPGPSVSSGIPAHHLAAIAAATAATMDRPYRIVQVRAPVVPTNEWSNQARLQTFNSHRRQGDWGRALPALNAAQSQAR
ncbi:OadG family transporter subunit [Roseospira navarrensis]|uniref:Uncharacterized protein n=1 Tax=Roseospira navarrensis TaxID=140058 RepID=A0A7X2D2U3_9PROT|nr:OadG family transporter subunit [Roseospira navarrensis]MQX36624.1 hypothetical protein [Roseospira navarrensis]